MAVIPLGIARTAIDTVIELAATKRPGRSARPLAEQLTVQAEVGRAEALYRCGRAFLYDSVAESWAVCRPVARLASRNWRCYDWRAPMRSRLRCKLPT